MLFCLVFFALSVPYGLPARADTTISVMLGTNIQISTGHQSQTLLPALGAYAPKLERDTIDGKTALMFAGAARTGVYDVLELGLFGNNFSSFATTIGGAFDEFSMGALVGPRHVYGFYVDRPIDRGALILGAYGVKEHDDQGLSIDISIGYHF